MVNETSQAVIVLKKGESEAVRLAVDDLISDIKTVTGKTVRPVDEVPTTGTAFVFVQTKTSDKREQYSLQTQNGNLYITGSNALGTVFGIYHFAENFLGVDPFYFWNDRPPQAKKVLAWKNINVLSAKPTFTYRGWFINDEDLLTEWRESGGRRNIDYPFYQQVVSPRVIARVCETALRMRCNLIIPASFVDILNPDEAALIQEAAKRGLYVSMHHVEPMGVSAFTYFNYWKKKTGEKPLFSYFSNREKVEEVWRVYAKEWAKYPNVIWQIGLRGIGDRPMWLADAGTPQSDADRGRLLSEAMRFQMNLIKEVDKHKTIPVTTTLWAEGSLLYNGGFLAIPEDVTVVFSDNSPGGKWQPDFYSTRRQAQKAYGIYYHHQLWSSGPHLVRTVPPQQTQKMLAEAVRKGDTAYCILNVSNVREFGLGIKASAEMLWDFRHFNLQDFNNTWFAERFGKTAQKAQAVYEAYFNSFAMSESNGTPVLMDGQTAGLGNGLLTELKLQLTDTAAYAALLQQCNTETEESKWVKTALADMSGNRFGNEALLQKVTAQRIGLQKVDSMAKALLPQLSPEANDFFQTSFLSQLKIITGLEAWLQKIVQAKIEATAGNRAAVKEYLQEAMAAFNGIEEGRHLATATDKWKNWYRGEKKMNLSAKKAATADILALLN